MKQYTFLTESKSDNSNIHVYNSIDELSDNKINQILNLWKQLDEVDFGYFKKINSKAESSLDHTPVDKNGIRNIGKVKNIITYEIDNDIVGLCIINEPCPRTVNKYGVRALCIDKKHRGKGIGFLLMNYIKKKFNNNLFIKVVANNNPAYSLYTKVGFKPWLISMVM